MAQCKKTVSFLETVFFMLEFPLGKLSIPKELKEMFDCPKAFQLLRAEYRGAAFVGVERQSLHQVQGGSLGPV